MSYIQDTGSNAPVVNSVSEFLACINDIIKYNNDQGSKFLFRGQENEEWEMETSAYRRLKRESNDNQVSEGEELYYNLGLIQQFRHADFHSKYSSEIMQQDLGILAQLQHMGAATSLIDFTDNATTALWFACKKSINSDSNHNNGKVFILFAGGEHNFEEIDSLEQIKNSRVRFPKQLEFAKENNILNNEKLNYWKPAHLNNRITAQQSYFLIGKREPPKMQEIVIAGASKIDMLEELSLVHGIERTTLFPDLVGFAQANSVDSAYGKEEKLLRKRNIIRHHDEIIEQSPEDLGAYSNRSIAKYNLGDYEGAIDDFTQAINIDPKNANAYNNRGYIKYQIERYKDATDDFNEAIKIDPSTALFYNNRGNLKCTLKKYQLAVNDYNEAIKIESNNALFYNGRGHAKRGLKDYKEAINDFTKAINIDPNDVNSYNELGNTKLKLKDYKEAINDFTKAIEIDPKNANLYYNRGMTEYESKDYKEAINDFTKAIEIDPKNANAYHSSGKAKLELNDYKEAINDYETALKHSIDKDLTEDITLDLEDAQDTFRERTR